MRYFIDTEFQEQPHTIELISLALVCEDGRELYVEVSDFDYASASDWLKKNVLPSLWHRQPDKSEYNAWTRDGGCGGLMRKSQIAGEVRRFIGDDTPEFWGFYADYDWVVFCWLFGSMVDLPDGWPMYCRDVKQVMDNMGLSIDIGGAGHNALEDAICIKAALDWIERQE